MQYDMLLTDWISIGLNKEKLAKAVGAIQKGKSLDDLVGTIHSSNRKYIEKILREEVQKQFDNSHRPYLEIILNSIDAKPPGMKGDYRVDVKVKNASVGIRDNGDGMSIEDILQFLIIPFNTQKKGIESIGQFGVGFFSTLNYCLHSPENKVEVTTNNGRESCQVSFYAKGNGVDSIRMRIRKKLVPARKGTSVYIRNWKSKREVKEYLVSQLHTIPEYVAQIRLGWTTINKANPEVSRPWKHRDVLIKYEGKELQQEAGFMFQKIPLRHKITLTSQGVRVKSGDVNTDHYNEYPGAVISFPPGARLVEGRDEFKIDDNYRRCVEAAYGSFLDYVKEEEWKIPQDDKRRKKIAFPNHEQMVNVLIAMNQLFKFQEAKEVPYMKEILSELLPGVEYIMSLDQASYLENFISDEKMSKVYPAPASALAAFQQTYKSGEDMMGEILAGVAEIMPEKQFRKRFEANPDYYPTLRPIAHNLNHKRIILTRFEPGTSPFMHYSSHAWQEGSHLSAGEVNLIINIDHPDVIGREDKTSLYANLANYLLDPICTSELKRDQKYQLFTMQSIIIYSSKKF